MWYFHRSDSKISSFLLFLCTFLLLTSCFKGAETETSETTVADPKIEKLKVPEGFAAEHLHSPSANDQGSWVSMTFDGKGRLIASDQYGALYRLTIPKIGDKESEVSVEKLDVNIGHAHGLLWAFNSLYVMVNNNPNSTSLEKESGFYRLEDVNNDDQFEKITLLKTLKGEGEHGPHSIILSPDGNSLFVINGNYTKLPEMDAFRAPPVWNEDNLFPLIKDPGGHATELKPPGGWVAKTDSLGKHWELFSIGYRNPFDLAINAAGDMFTFDSDMEWDLGTPWYRPTRICHVTSGSEYGWRTGSGKWSPAFPDNLPSVINMGQGSPTSLISGKTALFPEKYKNGLFAFDWSFGIIYAVHLKPEGASYTAEAEEFLSGLPLPLTDGVIGPDGALYFMTGGRRLESDLYRVYHKGSDNEKPSRNKPAPSITEENKLRRQLEEFHTESDPGSLNLIWTNLDHADRFIRFAARTALEHQHINTWQPLFAKEKDLGKKIEAAIALARVGPKSNKNELISNLLMIPFGELSDFRKVDLLRAYEIIFFRMGKPTSDHRNKILSQIDAHFPANTNILNRQLGKILVYLEAPKIADRTLTIIENADYNKEKDDTYNQASDLILRNPQYGLDIAEMLKKMPPAQQTYHAIMLSKLQNGWTPELRERYFKWFNNAFEYSGGRSYKGFINFARKDALAHVPESERAHFDEISGASLNKTATNMENVSRPKGPYRDWQKAKALAVVEGDLKGRDFKNGKDMFLATGCLSCHSMRGEGSNLGPELTQLGTRFSATDMVEHIVDPNKYVSDQYATNVLKLKDGTSVVGRLARENETSYFIAQNPFSPEELREVPKNQVVSNNLSSVSLMPPGLVNVLNEEELKDLIAYLMSGGSEDHPVYKE